VPEGWFIWAAGNRKEDRSVVFDMPAPLANRFLHLEVAPDFDSFKAYALERSLHEQIRGFLSFRPTLLHRLDPQQPAWPSPRSWEMASTLHLAELEIAPVVGAAAAAEFHAYIELYSALPDLDRILHGTGERVPFPSEPSARYATVIGLTLRAADAQQGYHALAWLANTAAAEWVQLFATDIFRRMRTLGQMGLFAQHVLADEKLQVFLQAYERMIT